MEQGERVDVVGQALEAVRHAIDATVGSTGPNHPMREAQRLLQTAEAEVADHDRALRTALHDLSDQLLPFSDGDRILSYNGIEILERFIGRTDVLYRLAFRTTKKPPSRSRPLAQRPGLGQSRGERSTDREQPRYTSSGGLGSEIDEDIYAEVLGVFALEARDQLQMLGVALRRLRADPEDYSAKREVRKRLTAMKGSSALVGVEDVRQLSHASEDLALAGLEGRFETADLQLLEEASRAMESLTLGDEAERSAVAVSDLVERLGERSTDRGPVRLPTTIGQAEQSANGVSGGSKKLPAGSAGRESLDQPTGVVDGEAESASAGDDDGKSREEQDMDSAAADAGRRLTAALAGSQAENDNAPTWEQDQVAKLDQLVRDLEETRALVERRRYRFDAPIRELRDVASHLRELAERSGSIVPALASDRGSADPSRAMGEQLTEELASSATELAALDLQLALATSELDSDLGEMRRLLQRLKERASRFSQVTLETLARRLHSVVRRTASERGKEAQLSLEGFDLALDHKLVESLGEVLLHLLRNSVEHGVELPELRRLRDKPRNGLIRVSAHRLGPRVFVEVNDDGPGINVRRVRNEAIKKGLSPASKLSDEGAWQLAMRPGFSTAEGGSGSGLDLVATLLSRVGGEIEVSSVPHRGTTVSIQIPTDLTLTRALVVERRGQVVAVPSAGVQRVRRLLEQDSQSLKDGEGFGSASTASGDDEASIYGAAASDSPDQRSGRGSRTTRMTIRFREQEYQVIDLAAWVGDSKDGDSGSAGSVAGPTASQSVRPGNSEVSVNPATEGTPASTVLLLDHHGQRRAVLVDRVRDAGELAVYPAGPLLERFPGILGLALGESDQLIPVLDPASLTQEGGLPGPEDGQKLSEMDGSSAPKPKVLVVDDVASVRRVVGLLLERLGATSLLAPDGRLAIDLLEKQEVPPMMALVDLEMPGMSGLELVAEIRQRNYDFPIYVFTSPAADLPSVDDLDVEGYVFKPLVRRELGALMKRHRDQVDAGSKAEGDAKN